MTIRTKQAIGLVVVALVLWWLFEAPHKAVSGDVELGTPTVKASDPDTQGEPAKGATLVAKKVAQGAVLGTHAAGVVLSDPFAPTLGVTGVTLGVAGKTTAVLDRGTTAIYNRLPVPAQLAVAPIVLGERVTAKTVAVAARAGGAVVGTLSSGAKSATSAVSSGVHKVLGWL